MLEDIFKKKESVNNKLKQWFFEELVMFCGTKYTQTCGAKERKKNKKERKRMKKEIEVVQGFSTLKEKSVKLSRKLMTFYWKI